MKSVKCAGRMLILVMAVCMLLTTVAYAAGDGSVWLKLSATSTPQGAAALIVTDTTVTDGVVELTYDSSKLTYQNVEVDDAYVAMYAVNAEEKGIVKISWVAPEAYQVNGDTVSLIQVNFTGKVNANSVSLSGKAYAEDGSAVLVSDKVDTNLPTGNANTGDDSLVLMAAGVAMAAAAGMAGLWVINKRRAVK